MKRISMLLFASTVLIACKQNDLLPSASTNDLDAAVAAKPSAAGNLKTRVLNNTLNFPWEILWGPDNYIWFTEREGRVKRMNPQTGETTLVATISEVASTTNFNGLLGMALHPNFSGMPYVYLVYNYFDAENDYMEKIVRYTYNGTTLLDPLTLVDGIVGKIGGDFIHNGSRLLIGADMKLYATTGDANLRFDLPQNTSSLNGKVLRINLDGTIPADNPYGNAVWAIGFRNSQGLTFGLGKLYSSEHGETTNDEINIIERGRNYGWPYVEGYCDMPAELSFCAANNVREPIYTWTPTVAPSGMEFYDKDQISQWKRSLLVTFLKDRRLRQMKLDKSGTVIEGVHEFFVNEFGRLRDVAISPDGKVYISTDNGKNADMIIEVSKGD
jgi:glucose/arabinose dehydrogenase